MKLEWVNHASYIIEHKDFKLLVDPWIEGSAFNNGWDLISKTKQTHEKLSNANYIWISHEHPDHFSPAFFKSIQKGKRKNITVLFQETRDKRVITFLKNIGYQTIELPLKNKYKIDSNIELICDRVGYLIDSYLLLSINGKKILNTNDCIINNSKTAKNIKKIVGEVDVLLTQFSYANWAGNELDADYRKEIAIQKLKSLSLQINYLKPKYIIPFASFIYFSHEENFYLNNHINKPNEVYNYLRMNHSISAMFFYPGEKWNFEESHDSKNSIKMYMQDFDTIAVKHKANKINKTKLDEAFKNYKKNIKGYRFFNIIGQLLSKSFETSIFLWDHNKAFSFNHNKGLNIINKKLNECDYQMSSESLIYILQFDFGVESLEVNGRFRTNIFNTRDLSYRFFAYVIKSRNLSFFELVSRLIKRYKHY